MKTKQFILALSLILAVHWQAKAQDYIPMVVENAQWIYTDYYPDWFPNKHYGYIIKGDTLINNVAYKKIYSRTFENSFEPPFVLTSEFYYCAIREDVEQKKIYVISDGNFCDGLGVESLMYDFNLSVGSTLTPCLTSGGDFQVTKIQELISFNEQRRTFEIELISEPGCLNVIWEGVGANTNLFYIACFESYSDIYHFCVGTHCMDGYITTSEEKTEANKLEIQFSEGDFLNVSSDLPEYDIHIYDTAGRETACYTCNSGTASFSLQHLSAGIYVVSILSKNQFLKSQKFVKL